MAHVVAVCTGNAARSVMAGAILVARLPELRVTTRGTHVIEGLPMSWRTRDAIRELGLDATGHRSAQLRSDDLADADLVVCLAAEHVRFVRARHPGAAARTATLRRLARDLPGLDGPLSGRLTQLGLDEVELELWEDVDDPAGEELPVFVRCAAEIDELLAQVAPVLAST